MLLTNGKLWIFGIHLWMFESFQHKYYIINYFCNTYSIICIYMYTNQNKVFFRLFIKIKCYIYMYLITNFKYI